MIETFNYSILNTFMTFQRMLRVETLPIEKEKFNQIEHHSLKVWLYTILSGGIAWLGLLITALCIPEKLNTVLAYQLLALLFVMFAGITMNWSEGIRLLRQMYYFHRHEFYIHYKRVGSILITTMASMALLFVFVAMGFYLARCSSLAFEVGDAHEAFYSDGESEVNQGICGFFIDGLLRVLSSLNCQRNVTLLYFLASFVEMVPILVFLLLDEPHDCFECFGKDPERIYSIF